MDDQKVENKLPQTKLLKSVEQSETFIMSGNNPLLRRLLEKSPSEGGDTVAERQIILLVRGIPEQVTLDADGSAVVGRLDLSTGYKPAVDLTPYDAHKRGVSREHVKLHVQDQHLYVSDLGSSNGTFYSGKRLTPNQPMMLRNGDELLLGGLAVKVLFE